MNLIDLIAVHKDTFTKSDKIIENYILNNLDIVSSYSIVTVAEKAGVSKSALLRFCKKLGYEGYSEFKYEISKHLLSGTMVNDKNLKDENIIEQYINCLNKLPSYISKKLYDKMCSLIKEAKYIKIFGVHESGLSATYLSYRLASLGIDSEAITNAGQFHEKAHFSNSECLCIFVSVSGTNESIIEAISEAFSREAKTILITQNNKSNFKDDYDCFISLPSLNIDKNNLFLDSQAIFFVTIDLLINKLSTAI